MASESTIQRLHQLIWVLIYGGLLACILGLFVPKQEEVLKGCLLVGGGVLVVLGLVLIYVRSRIKT